MSQHHDYDGITYREEQHAPNIFRILFSILVLWGVIFMGYYLFSGWSSPGEFDQQKKAQETVTQNKATAASTGAAAVVTKDQAKQLYAANCASCHGETAKGGVGPDLTISSYKYGKDKANLVKSILEGRPNGMPGFSGQITKEQSEALADYLISLK